jgi:hypothetical protein
MQTGLVHLHNLLRWVILILLVFSVVKSFLGSRSGKAFSAGDRKLWLFTMISSHITLLLGLYQLLMGRYGIISAGFQGEGSFMKDKFYRFFWLEHPLVMIIAIVFITLGYGMAKKDVADQVKYQKAFRYFGLALLLLLVAIPWPNREVIGRALFPGM